MLKSLSNIFKIFNFSLIQRKYFFCTNARQERIKQMLYLLKKTPNNQILLFKIANHYKQQNQMAEALEYYKKVVKLKSKFYQAYYNMALINESLNQIEQAVKNYQKTIELNDKHFDARIKLGKLLFKMDIIDQGIIYFVQALDINPKHFKLPNANLNEAIMELMENIRIIQEQEQDCADAYYKFAGFFNHNNFLEETLKCLDKAIETDPQFEDPYVSAGNLYLSWNNHEKAIEYFQKALQLNKDDLNNLNNLGAALVRSKRLNEAKKCFQKVLRIEPDNLIAYNNIGNVFLQQQLFRQAIQCYEKTIQLDPTCLEAYQNIAITYSLIDDLQEAINSYKKLIKKNPKHPTAYFDMAALYRRLNQDEQAIKILKGCLEMNPNYIISYVLLAEIYRQSKLVEKAQNYQQQFKKSKTNDINSLLKFAIKLYEIHQYQSAEKILKKAVEVQPDNQEAYFQLGFTLFLQKKIDQSIDCHLKGIQVQPNHNAQIYNNLGFVFKSIKSYQQAEKNFLKSLQINGSSFLPNFNLGQLYYELGQKQRAMRYIERALELNSNHERAIQIYNLLKETQKA